MPLNSVTKVLALQQPNPGFTQLSKLSFKNPFNCPWIIILSSQ